ncbi:response regulator [bacterium]|nr:response regulator [bacterium]
MPGSVLLVDDDPNLTNSIRRSIGGQFEFLIAHSAKDAMRTVQSEPIDVIVSDEYMPGGNGTELLKWTAKEFPDIVRIVLTGRPDVSVATRAINYGSAFRFLTKPCDASHLVKAIEEGLKYKKKRGDLQARLDGAMRQLEEAENKRNCIEREAGRLKTEIERLHSTEPSTSDDAVRKLEFFAQMTHEVRTPLTAILGYTKMLIAQGLGSEAENSLQAVQRGGDHLLTIVNDILDFSKIDSGMMRIERVECSLGELLSDVVALMKLKAAERNNRLELSIESDLPEMIYTDPTRLRQIVLNLVGNAVKFTTRGKVLISASSGRADQFGERKLFLRVSDTGIGMTETQLSRLFKPFSQATNSTAREYGGSGLGLVIARRLAQMLGGDIEATSKLNQGSVFTASLSVGSSSLAERAPTEKPAVSPVAGTEQVRLDGLRVLLAEDSPDIRRLIAKLLTSAGANVQFAEDGQRAVQLAMKSHKAGEVFDLILMDMQMPKMNGIEAATHLRMNGYVGTILALSAGDKTDDFLAAGCDGYLTKPIDFENFIKRVAEYRACNYRKSLITLDQVFGAFDRPQNQLS